jgi:hypothetical protein
MLLDRLDQRITAAVEAARAAVQGAQEQAGRVRVHGGDPLFSARAEQLVAGVNELATAALELTSKYLTGEPSVSQREVLTALATVTEKAGRAAREMGWWLDAFGLGTDCGRPDEAWISRLRVALSSNVVSLQPCYRVLRPVTGEDREVHQPGALIHLSSHDAERLTALGAVELVGVDEP